MLDVIYFLLIGLIAGWLAGKIMKGRSLGIESGGFDIP